MDLLEGYLRALEAFNYLQGARTEPDSEDRALDLLDRFGMELSGSGLDDGNRAYVTLGDNREGFRFYFGAFRPREDIIDEALINEHPDIGRLKTPEEYLLLRNVDVWQVEHEPYQMENGKWRHTLVMVFPTGLTPTPVEFFYDGDLPELQIAIERDLDTGPLHA